MNPNFSVHPDSFSSVMLFGLSLCNYALMYWAHIFLARHLSINAFDDFSVAVSVVTLLSTLATLGLEKYALRVVALYIERENWPRLLGFWQFSFRAISLFSLVLMGLTSISLSVVLAWHSAEAHSAILLYTLFLPVIALSLYLTEAITVFGAQILALALYRFVLPATFLLLIIGLHDLQASLTAEEAVICFGLAWGVTLTLMLVTAHATRPIAIKKTKADCHGKLRWLKRSMPLLFSSLLMTSLTSTGTIVLEILHPSEAAVGIFAVAMKTSGFIALLGTSTNRYYLPMLVVLVERRDQAGLRQLLNKRLRFMASFITLFLVVLAIWGQEILDLFGLVFSKGYWPLMICSGGAAIVTLFSDSLYYLQFMDRNRLAIGLMSITAASMLVLSFTLGEVYGATGVAIAYALPVTLLFSTLKWLTHHHIKRYFAVNAPIAPPL